MKHGILLLLALANASGCASPDQMPRYTDSDMAVANMIASRAATACNRVEYANEASPEVRTTMPISGGFEIRRLHEGSDKEWFKAEAVTQGIWDNIYYNVRTRTMVCGERSWQSYSDSTSIRFIELGVPQKKLPQ